MTSDILYEFMVLANTLNYSKSAQKLFITQSTLSRHIIELERELGIQVLERSTHNVQLTEAGKILLQSAKGLLNNYDMAISKLRTPKMEAEGTVRIACTESCICDRLFTFIRNFRSKYSEIDLIFTVTDGKENPMLFELHDLYLTSIEHQNLTGAVRSNRLFSLPAYLALTESHRFFCEQQISLNQLFGETLIVPYADEMFSAYASNRQLVEKLTRGKVNIIKVPNVQTALLMVGIGAGVSIIPQDMSERTMNGAKVVGINNPECKFDVYIYWNDALDNPAAKIVLEEMSHFSQSYLQ